MLTPAVSQSEIDPESKLAQEREELVLIEGKKSELEKELTSLGLTVKDLKESIRSLSDSKDSKSKELRDIQSLIDAASRKKSEVMEELKSVSTDHAIAKSNHADAVKKSEEEILQKADKSKFMDSEIQALVSKKSDTASEIEKLESQIQPLLDKQGSIVDLIKTAEGSLKDLSDSIESKKREIAAYDDIIFSKSQEIRALDEKKKEYDSLDSDAFKKKQEISGLEEKKAGLEKDLLSIDEQSKKKIADANERIRITSLAEQKLEGRLQYVNGLIDNAKAAGLLSKDFKL